MNDNTPIDLRTCKPGQKLRSCHGLILTYVRFDDKMPFCHIVMYPDGGYGSRSHDGQTYINNKMETDHDIVEILPVDE